MSADNGIYCLNLKDQSRVIHAQAIDNLWWSFITFSSEKEFVPTRLVEYFCASDPMSKESAIEKAFEMSHDYTILEYGVSEFDVDKTWEELVKEAKIIAKKEIKSIMLQDDWNRKKDWYESEVSALQSICQL